MLNKLLIIMYNNICGILEVNTIFYVPLIYDFMILSCTIYIFEFMSLLL